MIETKTKFKVDIFKNCNGMWSFGICLLHHFEETYVYINLFRWSISIGKLYTFDEAGEQELQKNQRCHSSMEQKSR